MNKKCKFEEHLRFCIFRKDIVDLQDRLNIENDVIHLIRLFDGTVCNDYIPNHGFIKQLGFGKNNHFYLNRTVSEISN